MTIFLQRILGISALLAALTLVSSGVFGDEPTKVLPPSPERIDLAHFPGEIIDKVVVPVPAEIFTVLDKLDESDWSREIEIPKQTDWGGDRSRMALTFGALVAEGFVAVQARSSSNIETIGRRVLTLGESLGLASSVRPHSLAIIEASNQKDWTKVRAELDATQETVRSTMEKLRDDELAGLISLGGWLRGTNVVTSLIGNAYSEEKAELLNQPGLITHFREMIAGMRGPSANSTHIRTIATGLARIEAIITDSEKLSEEDVIRLHDISQSTLEEFYFDKSGDAQPTPSVN